MKRYPSADEPIRIALDSYGFGQKESARDAITDLKFVDEYGSLIKQQTVEEGDSTSVIFDVEEGVGKYKSFFVLAEGKDYFGTCMLLLNSMLQTYERKLCMSSSIATCCNHRSIYQFVNYCKESSVAFNDASTIHVYFECRCSQFVCLISSHPFDVDTFVT